MASLDELTGAERQAEPSWHPALRFVEPLPGDPPYAPAPSECRPGVRAVGSSIGGVVMGADGWTLQVGEDELYHAVEHTRASGAADRDGPPRVRPRRPRAHA